jgi:hypothetical protein
MSSSPAFSRRVFVCLTAVIVAAASVGVFSVRAIARPAAVDPHTVTLIIDDLQGYQVRYSALEWSDEMTVFDALKAAESHERHPLELRSRGSGERAFVESLIGLSNEGARGEKRNWIYWVGTEFADTGAGSKRLNPGDVITWKYTQWPGEPGED